ncbi:MAG: ABC transporter ATP-binding protein [Desulfatiglandaceae bacterium]
MSENNFLSIDSVSMRFGGLQALDQVSFDVAEGQIYSLIGPNGAGKTTMFNCITRFYTPQGGRISFCGNDLLALKPDHICAIGITRTFQNIELFPKLSVSQNILIGLYSHFNYGLMGSFFRTGKVKREERRHRRRAEEIMEFLGLMPYQDQRVSSFPFAQQKLVELGRALVTDPKLILLDEPASGMNQEEKDMLARIISETGSGLNKTVLLVEHDMDFVMKISERICVLNFGEKLAEGTPEEIGKNPRVIKAYLGAA